MFSGTLFLSAVWWLEGLSQLGSWFWKRLFCLSGLGALEERSTAVLQSCCQLQLGTDHGCWQLSSEKAYTEIWLVMSKWDLLKRMVLGRDEILLWCSCRCWERKRWMGDQHKRYWKEEGVAERKGDVRHLSFLWLLPTSLNHGEKNPHGRRWVTEYSVELPCAESLERMALFRLLLSQPEHDGPFPAYRVAGGRRECEDVVVAVGSSVSCNVLMFLCYFLLF